MHQNAPATVLVIDDEPDNFDVATAHLDAEPYFLLYANSADRARQILATASVELILLDLMMPGTDGLAFCRELKSKSETAGIPVIMITALNDKEALARCLEAGADDFIGKPVSGLELRARARAHLRAEAQRAKNRFLVQQQGNALRELRRMLTAALPHELRTPLSGIVAPLELLQDESLNPEVRDLIEIIQESSQRMESLIERLLILLQLEATHFDPGQPVSEFYAEESTPLLPLLEATAHEVAAKAGRESDLHLELSPCGGLGLSEKALRILFHELLENACKFSAPGTPVSLVARRSEERALILFENRGRELSPEQFARVDPFVQFERERFEQQGLGLGLAIVREIVRLLPGATLELHPRRQGDGTTLCLALPLRSLDPDDPEACPEVANDAPAAAFP